MPNLINQIDEYCGDSNYFPAIKLEPEPTQKFGSGSGQKYSVQYLFDILIKK